MLGVMYSVMIWWSWYFYNCRPCICYIIHIWYVLWEYKSYRVITQHILLLLAVCVVLYLYSFFSSFFRHFFFFFFGAENKKRAAGFTCATHPRIVIVNAGQNTKNGKQMSWYGGVCVLVCKCVCVFLFSVFCFLLSVPCFLFSVICFLFPVSCFLFSLPWFVQHIFAFFSGWLFFLLSVRLVLLPTHTHTAWYNLTSVISCVLFYSSAAYPDPRHLIPPCACTCALLPDHVYLGHKITAVADARQ